MSFVATKLTVLLKETKDNRYLASNGPTPAPAIAGIPTFRQGGGTLVSIGFLLLAVLGGACGTSQDAEPLANERQDLISDQTHGAGTKGFFFLPPIAPVARYSGKFEPRLSPEVRIHRLDASNKPVALVALFTATSGPNGERVRRRLDRELYLVRFHADQFALDPKLNYRIEVYTGGKRLGFADVDVVGSAAELKKVNTKDFVGLLKNQTLAIKFRIEKAAVDRDGDGVFDWLDNCPTVKNPPVATATDVAPPKGALPAGCDSEKSSCDPAELDCNPLRFQQPDADHDGIGDACECPSGYSGGGLTKCVDVNECAGTHACDPLTTCTNTPGSFTCSRCPSGFTGNGKTGCVDVDECANHTATCNPIAACLNTVGGYQCGVCPSGYSGDGHTCVDVDECAVANGGCDPKTTCTNTQGSFTCGACPAGYTGGGTGGCVDIDECAGAHPACDARVACTNSAGSYQCGACPAGYRGDGQTCTDVDECAENLDTCSLLVTCGNTAGGYQCGDCPFGYRGDGHTCVDVNECATNNGGCSPVVTCSNLPGSFACGACPGGYSGGGYSCTDINECQAAASPCDPLVSCSNVAGGFLCGACPAGYTGDGKSGCLDIDECAQGTDACSKNPATSCSNTAGGYQCAPCPAGFTGDGKTCTDVDECQTGHGGCDPLVACTNAPGTFACGACPAGFTGGGSTGCADINECNGPDRACDPLANCTNSAGGFSCGPCPVGYTGDGVAGCLDIDECAAGIDLCSKAPRVSCGNTAGGYQCGACPAGYDGDGITCTDVNECAANNGGCDPLVSCTNTDGAFACGACPSGFTGDGVTCTDVNKCLVNNGGCDPRTSCTNTQGSRTCGPCPGGYSGNGATGCVDVHECAQGTDLCSREPRVSCINTDGSHACGACPLGFVGDGVHCVDVDECLTSHGSCDPLVACENSVGSHSCGACPTGYAGGGASGCADIDECQTNHGGCDPLAACLNTPGAVSCGPCPAGYVGSGVSCVDANECLNQNGGCGDPAYVTCVNNVGASPSCRAIAACVASPPGSTLCAMAGIAIGTPCDDGNACTQADVCVAGVCVGGPPVSCSALGPGCGLATCRPDTGACERLSPPGTPCHPRNATVRIGNGPSDGDWYLNAGDLADTLLFTSITIGALDRIIVEADMDLSVSDAFGPFLDVLNTLRLSAPVVEIRGNVKVGWDLILGANTLILDGTVSRASSVSSTIPIVSGTAPFVKALSGRANLQQALDLAAAGGVVSVAAGSYPGNLSIRRSVTLSGSACASMRAGAGTSAPKLFGQTPGGTLLDILAGPRVTVEGFHFGGPATGGGPNSVVGIAASSVNNVTIVHNTFDAFTSDAVKILSGDSPLAAYNLVTNPGAHTITATGVTNPNIHDNVVLP
ncbi:MAG: hypothetical protein H7X95_09945 [Deltaproteobacteria bacterium]|nr:hypothetical protein [Deltaproteobacteria bacterium]